MFFPRAAWFCALTFALACSRSTRSAQPAVASVPASASVPVSASSSPSAAGAPTTTGLCEVIVARTRLALEVEVARALGDPERGRDIVITPETPTGLAQFVPFEGGPPDAEVRLPCRDSRGGSWGVRLSDIELHWGPPLQAGWVIDAGKFLVSHVDSAGQERTFSLVDDQNPSLLVNSPWFDSMTLRPLDLDQDGRDEVLVRFSSRLRARVRLLLARRGDQIVKLEPSSLAVTGVEKGFFVEDVGDMTSDGLPDLLVAYELGAPEICGEIEHDPLVFSPPFLLHQLPDHRFVGDDAAARQGVRSWCPHRPHSLDTLEQVYCARLWGRSADELQAELERRYQPRDCEGAESDAHRADYAQLLTAASREPPFRLDRPTANAVQP